MRMLRVLRSLEMEEIYRKFETIKEQFISRHKRDWGKFFLGIMMTYICPELYDMTPAAELFPQDLHINYWYR